MIRAYLARNRVFVWDRKGAKKLFEKEYYGKLREDRLELSLLEACLLCEKGAIKIITESGEMRFEEFFSYCRSVDPRFEFRYAVYKDLRSRGLPTRTGFKFGCDFRVYERGSEPGKERIKWIVFCSAEDHPCNLDQLGKAIKLARNIRTTAIWAVVDNDSDVTYYIVGEAENL